jgi:3'-5' exoribonuclease
MQIEELKDLSKNNTSVKGVFVINKIELKPFKNKDGFFILCELSDKTGTIKGVVWDGAETIKGWLKNKEIVEITGTVSRYNDIPQIIITTIKAIKDWQDPSLFVPSLPKDKQDELFRYFMDVAGTIKNEVCKTIWTYLQIMSDDIAGGFLRCPGGTGDVHHAYMGGLAEHTLTMIKIAEDFAKHHEVDRDILLTGCLIHDIGKIWSYNWSKGVIEMSDAGRLLHHTALGHEILLKIASHGKVPYNDITLLKLKHIILSHHEEDSCRKPMFPEADAVSEIDAMDAIVNYDNGYIANPENQEEGSNWTKFSRLTERQYYNPKEVKKLEEPEKKKPTIDKDTIY